MDSLIVTSLALSAAAGSVVGAARVYSCKSKNSDIIQMRSAKKYRVGVVPPDKPAGA